jgi:hypothetical protein
MKIDDTKDKVWYTRKRYTRGIKFIIRSSCLETWDT